MLVFALLTGFDNVAGNITEEKHSEDASFPPTHLTSSSAQLAKRGNTEVTVLNVTAVYFARKRLYGKVVPCKRPLIVIVAP